MPSIKQGSLYTISKKGLRTLVIGDRQLAAAVKTDKSFKDT